MFYFKKKIGNTIMFRMKLGKDHIFWQRLDSLQENIQYDYQTFNKVGMHILIEKGIIKHYSIKKGIISIGYLYKMLYLLKYN